MDVTPEYAELFRAISRAVDDLQAVKDALVAAQQAAEDLFLERTE